MRSSPSAATTWSAKPGAWPTPARLDPDALPLGIHLPDGDGITFAAELLARDRARRVLLAFTDLKRYLG